MDDGEAMFPRRGFRVCSHGGDAPTPNAYWVRGRDVSAVAFVDGSDPGHGGFDALEETIPGIGQWLGESEAEPPLGFGGPNALLSSLQQKHYRGALAIVEPTMYLDEDGTPLRVVFGALAARVGAGRGPSPGVGAATDRRRFHVELAEDSATIVHWQRFRLGAPFDLRGRFAGAEHSAFGWLKVSYVLWSDGRADAHCASSFAPSAWFYRDYQRAFRHDMFAMAATDLEQCLRPKSGAPSGTNWTALDVSTGYVHAVA